MLRNILLCVALPAAILYSLREMYRITQVDNLDADLCGVSYLKRIFSLQKGKSSPQRIAIIGGGVGGSASAYFLRQLFGKDTELVVFEPAPEQCGRVATIQHNGREYESGGSLIHPANSYAKQIASRFGLSEAVHSEGDVGFFDGANYVLKLTSSTVGSLVRLIWAFGLDVFRLDSIEADFINKFGRIYQLQADGRSYETVKDLLYGMNTNVFVNATQTTACEFFSRRGIGAGMLRVVVNAGLRTNYGQTCDVNAFVGAVSMAGIQPGLWSVRGGNKCLCEKLLEGSLARIVTSAVHKIAASGEQFSIVTSPSTKLAAKTNDDVYDVVVVATPINRDKSDIDVTEVCDSPAQCPSAATDVREYRRTVATFVKGQLNSTLFGCNSIRTCPKAILTTEDRFYRSIGLHLPVDFDERSGDSVDKLGLYKVFSTQPLTVNQLTDLFENYTLVETVQWFAYPLYRPPDKLASFVLNHRGVYYTSPIEWSASAIEMSMISAKNAALLAVRDWYELADAADFDDARDSRTEL